MAPTSTPKPRSGLKTDVIMKITLIIFLLVVVLVAGFLFINNDSFDNFRELKKSLVETGPIAVSGLETNFIWNKIESSPEAVENGKSENSQIEANQKISVDDLNGDGRNEEYALLQGFLEIKQTGKLIWRSPGEWWIDNYFLADSNGDGKKEINLSVWKAGDFGPSKPFWIKKNDQSIKNHFFVMSLAGDELKPLWQSSNLEKPNCEFLFSDIDADAKQELIVIEGEYNNNYLCQGKYVALWRWNGWGFANYWRSQEGEYRNLKIGQLENKLVIKVNKNN